jgi:hypothetical protein
LPLLYDANKKYNYRKVTFKWKNLSPWFLTSSAMLLLNLNHN